MLTELFLEEPQLQHYLFKHFRALMMKKRPLKWTVRWHTQDFSNQSLWLKLYFNVQLFRCDRFAYDQHLTKDDYFSYTAELRVSIYQLCKQDFGPVTYILAPQMYNFHFDSKAFLVTEVDF